MKLSKYGCVTFCKGNVKLKGVRIDKMYVLGNNIYNKDYVCYYFVVSNSSYLWHLRLGHMSKIDQMSKNDLLPI